MSNVSQPDPVHVHDVNNTDYNNGKVVTLVSPPDLVYVDDVFNTEQDNANNNAWFTTLLPPDLGQSDISNTNDDDNIIC